MQLKSILIFVVQHDIIYKKINYKIVSARFIMNKKQYFSSVEKSLCFNGNNYRIKHALKNNGKRKTVAFLGGSITMGWNGEEMLRDNYSVFIYKYLCGTYPENDFAYVNMSIPSANSFIGLSILEKNIDSNIMPDIVFVEYAVNNECGREYMISYESLICKLLNLPSKPAVILVFTINQSFYTSQGYMKRIGENYGLPMISIADIIKSLVTDNIIEWSTYSNDWIHPNIWGHKFISDCLINFFKKVNKESTDEEYQFNKQVYSLDYINYIPVAPSLYDISCNGYEEINASEFFEHGLRYIPETNDVFLSFNADFKHLFMTYMHDKTEKYSDADIYVDNKKVSLLQGKSLYGWDNIVMKHICEFEHKGHHTVEINIKDRSKTFVLAEIGIY